MPAERQTAGRGVNQHEPDVNSDRNWQTASGKRQVAAAIENERGKGADSEFEAEKRPVAATEQARHQRVAFAGQIQVQPKQCELGVEPVESEQQQALGQCAHLDPLRQNLLNSGPLTSEPPELSSEGS